MPVSMPVSAPVSLSASETGRKTYNLLDAKSHVNGRLPPSGKIPTRDVKSV